MWEAALGTEEAAEVDDVGLNGKGGGGGGDGVLSFPPRHPRMWVIKWTGHCLCPSLIAVFFQLGKKVSGSVSFSGVPRGTFVGRPRRCLHQMVACFFLPACNLFFLQRPFDARFCCLCAARLPGVVFTLPTVLVLSICTKYPNAFTEFECFQRRTDLP